MGEGGRTGNDVTRGALRANCPECGTEVDWKRQWLRGSIWARWSCPGCGRVLRFDARRRVGLLLICSLVLSPATVVMICRLSRQDMWGAHWLVAGTLALASMVQIGLFVWMDQVEVAADADPNACRQCGYDVRVQREAGLPHCPECGHASR